MIFTKLFERDMCPVGRQRDFLLQSLVGELFITLNVIWMELSPNNTS